MRPQWSERRYITSHSQFVAASTAMLKLLPSVHTLWNRNSSAKTEARLPVVSGTKP
jgi:hypothetical protein